jgi:hypothetical protein
MSTITKEQAQKIIEAADEVITALVEQTRMFTPKATACSVYGMT